MVDHEGGDDLMFAPMLLAAGGLTAKFQADKTLTIHDPPIFTIPDFIAAPLDADADAPLLVLHMLHACLLTATGEPRLGVFGISARGTSLQHPSLTTRV